MLGNATLTTVASRNARKAPMEATASTVPLPTRASLVTPAGPHQ